MMRRRIIQLRLAISVGCEAIGTSASMKFGKRHAPDPRVHAAHRVAHHQPHVLDAEPFGQQAVLRRHHVVVVVARELGALAVRRLGRLAMADGIGQDDEVLGRVERLARAEQFAAECRRQHARRGAGGAMQHQHRLAAGCTDRGVAQLQFGHHLAGVELEVACDPAGLLGGGKLRGQRWRRPSRRRPMTREAVRACARSTWCSPGSMCSDASGVSRPAYAGLHAYHHGNQLCIGVTLVARRQ